jgi:hypothetical protein
MFSERLGCIRTLKTSEGWLKQAVALHSVSHYWGLLHWCQYLQSQTIPLHKVTYPLQAPAKEVGQPLAPAEVMAGPPELGEEHPPELVAGPPEVEAGPPELEVGPPEVQMDEREPDAPPEI